ncbi:MAG: hypothetical protein Q7T77_12375 [Sulfuricurvum sp.]|nr:hypothetical protein [Sulfuricurvum sp.]
MEEIIYEVQYSDKKYLQIMKEQGKEISLYISNSNNTNRRIEKSNPLKNVHSFDRKIDQAISSMKEGDCFTISHLDILGNSMHRILKRLDAIYTKKCSLHIIVQNIFIQPSDTTNAMKFLNYMLKISNVVNDQKKEAVKITLKSSGKKTGRVSGKIYKSKFDPYRSKIMTMHSKEISKKNICETIGIGTPQAIGKYIKAMKEKELTKKPKKSDLKKSYISRKLNDKLSFNI